MAPRQIRMPAKTNQVEQEAEQVFSQSKRPERGRYLLQVDRQTKNSYTTSEAAQSAALAIKTGYLPGIPSEKLRAELKSLQEPVLSNKRSACVHRQES